MVTPSRGFVWEVLRDERILVSYSDGPGSEQQWREYIVTLTRLPSEEGKPLRILAYAADAPPRAALDGIMSAARGKSWRVALISPSTAVRFVASTFSFVIRTLRFFAPNELGAAFEHLGCSEVERRRASEALARLRE
jgi:hypothetical protein